MYVLNEKLYGDFTKLQGRVKELIVKPEVMKKLSYFGVEQDSKIVSKTFAKGTDPVKAIRITAKELDIEEPRVVVYEYSDNVYGFVNDEAITTKSKIGDSAIITFDGVQRYSKKESSSILDKLSYANEFTVYVFDVSENRKYRQRIKDRNSGSDKYAPGIFDGPSDFMRDAKDPGSTLRMKHAQSKIKKGKVYDITLTDFKSFKHLLDVVKREDTLSIQVDGLYINPLSSNGISFKEMVRLLNGSTTYDDLFNNGVSRVAQVYLSKEPVTALSDIETFKNKGRWTYITAVVNNGEIRFTVES